MLLDDYLQSSIERDDRNQHQLRRLRHEHKEADAGLARLLDLVEKGLMEVEDAALRERMVSLKFRRDELAREISDLIRRLESSEPLEIGRASCRERVCQYVSISVVAVSLKKTLHTT